MCTQRHAQKPFLWVLIQACFFYFLTITDDQLSSPLTFQTIMEQFNPCLRNFVAMGKNYEKALSSKLPPPPNSVLIYRSYWAASQRLPLLKSIMKRRRSIYHPTTHNLHNQALSATAQPLLPSAELFTERQKRILWGPFRLKRMYNTCPRK